MIRIHRAALTGSVLAVFVLAAVLGRTTVIDGANLSLVCPAAGVGALWVVSTSGRRRRIALLGVAFGTGTAYLLTGASMQIAVLVSATNVLQAATFAALARRSLPDVWPTRDRIGAVRPFADVRDLTALATAAGLGCLVAAAAGTTVVAAAGGGWDLLGFCVWWGRNTVGMLAVTLLVVLTAQRLRDGAPALRLRTTALGAVVAVGTYVVYLLVFYVAHGDALAFVVLAPTLVVGLRCQPLVTTLHGIVCTTLAIAFTLRGEGPFAVVTDLTGRALVVQAFVLLTTAVGLSLSFARSQERRTVEQLRESGARWSLLLDSLPDMTVFTLGRSLRVGHVAGAGSWTTGLAGASGRSIATLSSPENLDLVRTVVARALDGEKVSADVRASTNDHEHHVLATALPASDGHAPEVLVVARDVSGERAREREITAARDRAEQLFEDAPHGIAVLAGDGTILRANRALSRLLAGADEGLAGTPLARRAARRGDRVLGEHLAEVLTAPGTTVETTWRVRNGDGQHRVVALSSSVLAGTEADPEVLTTVVDVSEQVGLQNRLQHLAHHDALTGLANRRRFEEQVALHLRRPGGGSPGAVLVIDLDHFKAVNDSLGHAAGDRLLRAVADRLRSGLAPGDLLARLGGDEFAVLLPTADLTCAERAAATIVRAVTEVASRAGAGPEGRVTASVGGVLIGGRDVPALLEAADRMLYVAKRRGRDQHVLRDALATAGPAGPIGPTSVPQDLTG